MTELNQSPISPENSPSEPPIPATPPQPQAAPAGYEPSLAQQPQAGTWQQSAQNGWQPQQGDTWQQSAQDGWQPQQGDTWQQSPETSWQQQTTWQIPQQPEMPAGQYAQPMAVATQPVAQSNGKATAALVCGIIAILASPTVFLGIILGIVAIVLAVLSRKQSRDGKATAGLICGAIGAVLSVLLVVAGVALVGEIMNDPEFQQALQDYDDSTSGTDGTVEGGLPDSGGDSGTTDSTGTGTGEPVVNYAPGTYIADDDVCTIKINDMYIDGSDDLIVEFTISSNCESDLVFHTDNTQPCDMNGNDVLCVCYTDVAQGETKDDFFYVPSGDLPEGGIDAITNFNCVFSVDIVRTGDTMTYWMDLPQQ